MKTIGSNLNIGNITTYTARHSYATILNTGYIDIHLFSSDSRSCVQFVCNAQKKAVMEMFRNGLVFNLWAQLGLNQ